MFYLMMALSAAAASCLLTACGQRGQLARTRVGKCHGYVWVKKCQKQKSWLFLNGVKICFQYLLRDFVVVDILQLWPGQVNTLPATLCLCHSRAEQNIRYHLDIGQSCLQNVVYECREYS